MATRPITPEETAHVDELVARGRSALAAFEGATQQDVDRLCQAVTIRSECSIIPVRQLMSSIGRLSLSCDRSRISLNSPPISVRWW